MLLLLVFKFIIDYYYSYYYLIKIVLRVNTIISYLHFIYTNFCILIVMRGGILYAE